MSVINLENIHQKNGDKKLYINANLKINKGEHIALIGPNGCGKTTLLNIINKKIIPDKGNVDWHPKLKIGFLEQHQTVDKNITVEQYLKEAFRYLYNLEEQITKLYSEIAVEYSEKNWTKH